MKVQEPIINQQAVCRVLEQNPNVSDLQLVQRVVAELAECLSKIRKKEQEQTPVESELTSLTRLRPTDEQLRRALLRLLALRDGSDRPLLYKKTHWLAVCRALQHIGRIDYGRGCWAQAESSLNQWAGRQVCEQREISRKAAEKPFHHPLGKWVALAHQPYVSRYWEIAVAFLHLVEDEMHITMHIQKGNAHNYAHSKG